MDAQINTLVVEQPGKNSTISLPVHIYLLAVRTLTTLLRTPEALLPPLAISIFFLVIYQSTLGKASSFIPGIGGSYLGFILPLSIVSGSLSGSGIAAQNLVRDIERGYFDKLLLTPVRRAALLLAPILAGGVILGIQSTIVVGVGLLLGLKPATGLPGLLVVIGLGVLLGLGFAGFTVSAALGSGSAAATQGASFPVLPTHLPCPHLRAASAAIGLVGGGCQAQPHHLCTGGNALFAQHGLGCACHWYRHIGLSAPGSCHVCLGSICLNHANPSVLKISRSNVANMNGAVQNVSLHLSRLKPDRTGASLWLIRQKNNRINVIAAGLFTRSGDKRV